MSIGHVVSGAMLCVWAEFIMLIGHVVSRAMLCVWAEFIQLLSDNESVDVASTKVSSGDDVINNVDDGVDEIIYGDNDDDEVPVNHRVMSQIFS